MASDGLYAALLAVYYLLTSDGLAVTGDSSTHLTIYKRCTIDVNLRGNCRFLVTFSNCMKRSMSKAGLKGHGAESLHDTTSARDTSQWHGAETNLGSTDGQKVLVHPCSCNTSVDDIANMKADFYNEWVRLVPHVRRSKRDCWLELVDLFRGSNDACYFQNTKVAANIQCQLPLNQTGPSCPRTWSRLRPCSGFQTRTPRHQVCICAFSHKILRPVPQTDLSLYEKTHAAPTQRPVPQTDLSLYEKTHAAPTQRPVPQTDLSLYEKTHAAPTQRPVPQTDLSLYEKTHAAPTQRPVPQTDLSLYEKTHAAPTQRPVPQTDLSLYEKTHAAPMQRPVPQTDLSLYEKTHAAPTQRPVPQTDLSLYEKTHAAPMQRPVPQTDLSLYEKTHAAPTQQTAQDVLSAVEVNSFGEGLLNNGTLSVGKHLCPNGAPYANCTRLVNERSADTKHCPPGYFGNECQQRCYCKNRASCHRSTGTCDYGCEIGWTGHTCNQRVCSYDDNNMSYYGVLPSGEEECWLQCMCSTHENCNVLNGECISGSCPHTEEGIICADQVCPRRYLKKPKCAKKCYCYNDMVCNPLTGKCPGNLCRHGYVPPDCTKKKTILIVGAQGFLVLVQIIVVATKIAIAFYLRVIPMFYKC
ncbi:hypothetical protein BsWGS_25896 [Bradybaena similaris]